MNIDNMFKQFFNRRYIIFILEFFSQLIKGLFNQAGHDLGLISKMPIKGTFTQIGPLSDVVYCGGIDSKFTENLQRGGEQLLFCFSNPLFSPVSRAFCRKYCTTRFIH